jgi:hypothetical protein
VKRVSHRVAAGMSRKHGTIGLPERFGAEHFALHSSCSADLMDDSMPVWC